MEGSIHEQLGSITSIVATTILAVEFAKKCLGNVTWAKSVPTWIYSVVIAIGLTLVALKGLHSISGDLVELLWQAVTNAAMASGFYEWMNHHDLPLSESAQKLPSIEIQ